MNNFYITDKIFKKKKGIFNVELLKKIIKIILKKKKLKKKKKKIFNLIKFKFIKFVVLPSS